MRKLSIYQICVIGLCVALNFVGSNLALMLKLPIYLDTIGTVMASALFGSIVGMLPGIISSLISGFTTDVISLYFIPVQMMTGFMVGVVYQKGWLKKARIPVGTILVAIPGTIVASIITVIVFGGITSSGSSLFVQISHHLGMNLTVSVFLVQVVTDYLDRLVAISIVMAMIPIIAPVFQGVRNKMRM